MLLEFEHNYTTQQRRVLEYGITNNISIYEIKNPAIPTSLMEAFIECRAYGYCIEILEDYGLGLLSIVYLDCIKELVRHDIDIFQLTHNGRFIPYNNSQILTITDGLLNGFNLRLFGNIELSHVQMRSIITQLEHESNVNTYSTSIYSTDAQDKLIDKLNCFKSNVL